MKFMLMVCALFALVASAARAESVPDCLDNDGNVIAVDNQDVAQWKTTTKNQWQSRAHVTGEVTDTFPDQTGHHHFEITLDDTDGATLEVIYDEAFGPMPTPKISMRVEACGDYITSFKATKRYQPSPDGALIHWIHLSTNEQKHPSGYLALDGQVCGLNYPDNDLLRY